MREVIASLNAEFQPLILTRQVNFDKYEEYDRRGWIKHRRYSLSGMRIVEQDIRSPVMVATSARYEKELVSPDDFLLSESFDPG
jgi:hypothetical protein